MIKMKLDNKIIFVLVVMGVLIVSSASYIYGTTPSYTSGMYVNSITDYTSPKDLDNYKWKIDTTVGIGGEILYAETTVDVESAKSRGASINNKNSII